MQARGALPVYRVTREPSPAASEGRSELDVQGRELNDPVGMLFADNLGMDAPDHDDAGDSGTSSEGSDWGETDSSREGTAADSTHQRDWSVAGSLPDLDQRSDMSSTDNDDDEDDSEGGFLFADGQGAVAEALRCSVREDHADMQVTTPQAAASDRGYSAGGQMRGEASTSAAAPSGGPAEQSVQEARRCSAPNAADATQRYEHLVCTLRASTYDCG
jgi:hypothetical protein